MRNSTARHPLAASPRPEEIDKYRSFLAALSERERRHCVAHEVLRRGRGGLARLCELSGLSHPTILRGVREIRAGESPSLDGRARHLGGGRKPIEWHAPKIVKALDRILEPHTAGDPGGQRRWSRLSLREIASRLRAKKYPVAKDAVARLVKKRALA